MSGKAKKEVDYEAAARKWFGQRALAADLQSVIQEVARYAHDSAHSGTPSQRKSKLAITHRAAEKLILHIGSLNTMVRAKLSVACEPGVGDGVPMSHLMRGQARTPTRSSSFSTLFGVCHFFTNVRSLNMNTIEYTCVK